jgi:hypothetical protein
MANDGTIPDARQTQILDWLFGGGSLPTLAEWDLSLWSGTNPFTGGAEPTDGAYARRTVPSNTSNWSSAAGGQKQTAIDVRFPASGNTGAEWAFDWLVLIDKATGNKWYRLEVTSTGYTTSGGSPGIGTGSNMTVAAGDVVLQFRLSGELSVLTDYVLHAVANRLFGGVAFTPPATVQVSLWDGDPRAGGTEASTVGTGYARLALANNSVTWQTAAIVKRNALALIWPASGGFSAPIGWVSHICLHDAGTGELLAAVPRTGGEVYVDAGLPLRVEVGDFVLGFGDSGAF